MTDEQIIKTLECCISGDDWNTSCKLCPFESECNVGRQLERLTLNLINRQKAEIERITEKYNCQQTVYLKIKPKYIQNKLWGWHRSICDTR